MAASPLLEKLDAKAEAAMRDFIAGALHTQAVYVVAKLGIPDLLALGPRDAGDLAQRAGAHPETLRRILRYLASRGIFSEDAEGRFGLTAMGEYLQSGHPRSLRPSAIRAGEGLWQTAAGLLDAVRTGVTPHQAVHGAPFFDQLAGKEAVFAARMSGSTAGLAEAIAAHPALEKAATLVDVGGGNGWLLAEVLQRRRQLQGLLLDTEGTIAAARDVISKSESAARCRLVAGDFFHSVPQADVALLSWVLHDWDDERARRIVRACHAAGIETLLVVEVLLPERAFAVGDAAPDVLADPFAVDLQMLLLTGGKERTLGEYRELLGEEGYELKSASAVASKRGASVLTARWGRG